MKQTKVEAEGDSDSIRSIYQGSSPGGPGEAVLKLFTAIRQKDPDTVWEGMSRADRTQFMAALGVTNEQVAKQVLLEEFIRQPHHRFSVDKVQIDGNTATVTVHRTPDDTTGDVEVITLIKEDGRWVLGKSAETTLSAGDHVEVHLTGIIEPMMIREIVDEKGCIALPVLGSNVRVAGQTTSEAERMIIAQHATGSAYTFRREGCLEAHGNTAMLDLQITPDERKSVSVELGQSTMDVIKRCEPATFYCDDDPWVAYAGPGDTVYVLYFAPGDSVGKHDPSRDALSGVAHFPANQGYDPGVFILPDHKRGQKCPKKYSDVKAILERGKVEPVVRNHPRDGSVRQVKEFLNNNWKNVGPNGILEWGHVKQQPDGTSSVAVKARGEDGKIVTKIFSLDAEGKITGIADGEKRGRFVLCVQPQGPFEPESESELLSELNAHLPFTIPQKHAFSKRKSDRLTGWVMVENAAQKDTVKAELKKSATLRVLQVEAMTPEFKERLTGYAKSE